MLVIREYLMTNKYKAGDGESVPEQRPDLFPLMMYIYYGILFLAVLSSFRKSHALRLVSILIKFIVKYKIIHIYYLGNMPRRSLLTLCVCPLWN